MTDAPMHCGQPMMGLQWRGYYDGALIWWCPNCDCWRHRFTEGPLRKRAERAVADGLMAGSLKMVTGDK